MSWRGTNPARHPWYELQGRPQTPEEIEALENANHTFSYIEEIEPGLCTLCEQPLDDIRDLEFNFRVHAECYLRHLDEEEESG